MKAYVELIQRKEREIGCDVLTHQKVRHSGSVRYSDTDNPVVRSRLRRFNDDDRHRWNVSSAGITGSSIADVIDHLPRQWVKE